MTCPLYKYTVRCCSPTISKKKNTPAAICRCLQSKVVIKYILNEEERRGCLIVLIHPIFEAINFIPQCSQFLRSEHKKLLRWFSLNRLTQLLADALMLPAMNGTPQHSTLRCPVSEWYRPALEGSCGYIHSRIVHGLPPAAVSGQL